MHKITTFFSALVFMSLTLFANSSHATTNNSNQSQSQQVIDAFNVIYPDLNLAVATPAPESVLIEELEVLRAALRNNPVEDGSLAHLTCCRPSCGRDCGK